MKKVFSMILASVLAFIALGCGSAAETSQISTADEESRMPEVIIFTDPVLEQLVRNALGNLDSDITTAEAEAVTSLNLAGQMQQSASEQQQITDISGLEHFKNLESLDLSNQAIMDLSPLSGLVALRTLLLSNCPAIDYSFLKQLVNLNILLLNDAAIADLGAVSVLNKLVLLSFTNTQIGDLSPLANLQSLRFLYLKGCPIEDYVPLNSLYPLLVEKDFEIVEYLSDLGFNYSRDTYVADCTLGPVFFQICHSDWGTPPDNYLWLMNSILMKYDMSNDYTLIILYNPDPQDYCLTISSHGETLTSYVYLSAKNDFVFGVGDRDSAEQSVRAAFGDADSDDILLAFIPVFHDMVKNEFSMSPDALYALPNVRPTLLNLGFAAHEEEAYCEFVRKDDTPKGEIYHSICVHRPEWGKQDYDVRFFTSIKNYGLVITYDIGEQYFRVSADNQSDGSYAVFDYFPKDDSVINKEASKGAAVEEYFTNVYNDPDIKDVYRYSVLLMEQYIEDTFGLGIEELYALPVGD